jgi:hypothetical protein
MPPTVQQPGPNLVPERNGRHYYPFDVAEFSAPSYLLPISFFI